MGKRSDWEEIERLGGGGQSDVFLVRTPARVQKRREIVEDVLRSNLWGPIAFPGETPEGRAARIARGLWEYARPDADAELGALKVFKIPPENEKRLSPPPGPKELEAVERPTDESRACKAIGGPVQNE